MLEVEIELNILHPSCTRFAMVWSATERLCTETATHAECLVYWVVDGKWMKYEYLYICLKPQTRWAAALGQSSQLTLLCYIAATRDGGLAQTWSRSVISIRAAVGRGAGNWGWVQSPTHSSSIDGWEGESVNVTCVAEQHFHDWV